MQLCYSSESLNQSVHITAFEFYYVMDFFILS